MMGSLGALLPFTFIAVAAVVAVASRAVGHYIGQQLRIRDARHLYERERITTLQAENTQRLAALTESRLCPHCTKEPDA